MERYGYVRISSKDQDPDRQMDALLELGVDKNNIYIDRISGKDFNRPAYKKLIRNLKKGDLIFIKSIDRLGRNYAEILDQWRMLTKGEFTKTGKNTVRYETASSKIDSKNIKIPATIKHNKKVYKVTSVAAYAFTGYDKLETVIIGKNIKKIGKNAFNGCTKLKTITINSKKLTAKSVKGAFKGSAIKTVIVPVDKVEDYKKIFTKKNTGSSSEITVKAKKE